MIQGTAETFDRSNDDSASQLELWLPVPAAPPAPPSGGGGRPPRRPLGGAVFDGPEDGYDPAKDLIYGVGPIAKHLCGDDTQANRRWVYRLSAQQREGMGFVIGMRRGLCLSKSLFAEYIRRGGKPPARH